MTQSTFQLDLLPPVTSRRPTKNPCRLPLSYYDPTAPDFDLSLWSEAVRHRMLKVLKNV